jgi:hypothetical protein
MEMICLLQARRGDKDFIAHSLDLFIDFVQIFRKVLILLMQKVSSGCLNTSSILATAKKGRSSGGS